MGLGDGGGGIIGQQGAHLDGDIAVKGLTLIIEGAQHIGGGADIVDHQVLIDGGGVFAGCRLLEQVLLIVGAAGDGLAKDAGVGSYTANTLVHHLAQLTAADQRALDIVEPNGLPQFSDLMQFGHRFILLSGTGSDLPPRRRKVRETCPAAAMSASEGSIASERAGDKGNVCVQTHSPTVQGFS